MTSLEEIFSELGISQYLGAFLNQGFDSWETILDITESDLDHLEVKLGHRRKLQRRIANYRGVAPSVSLISPTRTSIEDNRNDSNHTEPPRPEGKDDSTVVKRKYRRHPKPDENAPERPPSAYVLFSNKMRDDLKGQNLTFTEIAKLVGENWQNLDRSEKEPFERQANAAKEKYNHDLNDYKRTPHWKKYNAYLQDFRKRQALQNQNASKRFKPETDSPRGSSTSAGPGGTSSSNGGSPSQLGSEPPPTRQQRLESIPSLPSATSYQSEDSRVSPRSYSLEDPVQGRQRGLPSSHSRDSSIQSTNFHLGKMDTREPPATAINWLDPRGAPMALSQSPSEASSLTPPQGPASFMSRRPDRGSQSSDRTSFSRGRPSLKAEQSSAGSISSTSSMALPRTPSDASLPIHALLSSKGANTPPYVASPSMHQSGPPIPAMLPNQPGPQQHNLNGHAHYGNGPAAGLFPNTQPDHGQASDFSYFSRNGHLPRPTLPSASTSDHNLDGISALLKAREIVDQRP